MSNVEDDIQKKIERERNIIQGAKNLKKKTNNEMVIQKCNTNIREAQQNIKYLEETLKKFQLGSDNNRSSRSRDENAQGTVSTSKGYGALTTIDSSEKVFSRLDLMKYDCPSLSQRIQYMLQQLEFKLQVEKQYQEANAKLTKLYQIDGDRRTSSAAQGEKEESRGRIQLLAKSLKKYQAINVDLDQLKVPDTVSVSSDSQPKFRRKQLSGTLTVGIAAIRDVDHIQSPMFSRKPNTFIVIKIDDTVKYKTKPSTNDKWNEEIRIQVGKGNEVEISIYDEMNGKITSVAVMWFLLSDIAEAIRKMKVNKTHAQQGWVDASRVMSTKHIDAPHSSSNLGGGISSSSSSRHPQQNASSSKAVTSNSIKSWFILEPTGQIQLTLGFTKSTEVQKKQVGAPGALHRQGAIVNRNEEVFEQHGHHFAQKTFYNIMECSYCGEFLRYNGLQCQDCRVLCHKKCYTNIVTKCIATSSHDIDPNEPNLSHHIPHRFEPFSNRGTKWCCHCGYILPWGRQKVRKCSECGIMCHSQCAHLVPDFCGMSMEMANKILKTIQDTQRTKSKKTSQRVKKKSTAAPKPKVLPATPSKAKSPEDIQRVSPRKVTQQTRKPSRKPPKKLSLSNISVDSGDLEDPFVAESENNDNTLFGEAELYSSFTTNAFNNVETTPGKAEQIEDMDHQTHIDSDPILLPTPSHQTPSVHNVSPERVPVGHQYIPTELDTTELQVIEMKQTTASSAVNPFRSMNEEDFLREQTDNIAEDSFQQSELVSKQEKHVSKNSVISFSPQKQLHKHKKRASRRRKVSLDDFILLKVLGKGNFGKVLLSKSKNTGTICAIKVLKKDHIIQNHDIESARAEKKVFLLASKARHPFLTNLYCSFQTENRIYFAMEFVGGGDLMWHVQNQRLSVRRAKFYAAEVLLALQYFHDNGVVYRDLKLENILLTPEGHIKIADYGLCKDEMWFGKTTSTFCGTPEFMAPEILKEQDYTKAVDWWAFGVLLYQMLLCQSPFSGDDEDEVFNAILTDEPLYPIDMAGDIVQIFQGLLTKDPEKRLGAGPRDALEVMEEPFFRNINFDDILNLRTQPPYIPKIKGSEDTSYFEQEFTSAPPTLTPIPTILSVKDQEEFRGFSFMPDDLEL